MTTTPDFRALLADDAYAASFQSLGQYRTALIKALATPPPEPPTDEEIVAFLYLIDPEDELSPLAMARAALERWGHA